MSEWMQKKLWIKFEFRGQKCLVLTCLKQVEVPSGRVGLFILCVTLMTPFLLIQNKIFCLIWKEDVLLCLRVLLHLIVF